MVYIENVNGFLLSIQQDDDTICILYWQLSLQTEHENYKHSAIVVAFCKAVISNQYITLASSSQNGSDMISLSFTCSEPPGTKQKKFCPYCRNFALFSCYVFSGYSEQPVLLVPWRVINELDRLKDNNNGNGPLCKRAKAAMNYLYQSLPENRHITGNIFQNSIIQ